MLCNSIPINEIVLLTSTYLCKWPVATHSSETTTSKQSLKFNLHRPVILNETNLNSNRTIRYSQRLEQVRSSSAEARVFPHKDPETFSQLSQDDSIFTIGSGLIILGGHILSGSSFAKNGRFSKDIACKSPKWMLLPGSGLMFSGGLMLVMSSCDQKG